MHQDEIEISGAMVRQLLAAQFPQWASLSVEPVLPLGTDNVLYRLGNEMVVRLPRRQRTVETLLKERLWLPTLARELPVPVPTPIVEGEPGEGYPFPWSVYSWLRGENATINGIHNLNQFANDLADFITALQKVDSSAGPAPGEHNFFRGAPLKSRDEMTRAAIERLGDQIDRAAVSAVWETALAVGENEHSPVWIHGDLDFRNLLVELGRLSAVIDFGCLAVGDPACDFMVAWKLFRSDSRDPFRTRLAIDDRTWSRSRGWVLSQALMILSYYDLENNPTLVLEAEQWLKEALTDTL
ncbi:aminoglycoside phosphotransferase family protein [Acidobacteria bacterium AB60]|nr:aminoglycoside phosphotransferase family protein [Acidobacteria bacterium AB60]